jgi:hypothetical protein
MNRNSKSLPYCECDSQEKVARLCRNATYHAIRGLGHINDQSQRLWSEFETVDCEYHLAAAIGFLQEINKVLEKHSAEVAK